MKPWIDSLELKHLLLSLRWITAFRLAAVKMEAKLLEKEEVKTVEADQ